MPRVFKADPAGVDGEQGDKDDHGADDQYIKESAATDLEVIFVEFFVVPVEWLGVL